VIFGSWELEIGRGGDDRKGSWEPELEQRMAPERWQGIRRVGRGRGMLGLGNKKEKTLGWRSASSSRAPA
jgi:hypothetical protein